MSRSPMKRAAAALIAAAIAGAMAILPMQAASAGSVNETSARHSASSSGTKPTIVLVHGAWADSSSWAPTTAALQTAGYKVLVPPNPLRGLSSDAAYLSSFLAQQTTGPVVLVGHSYGGAVVTNAAATDPDVKALVFVDAFVPAEGESIVQIIGGSTSALNVPDPTTVFNINGYPGAPAGDADVYLKPETFAKYFAQDVAAPVRNVLAAGQKPVTLAALSEPSGDPAWDDIPSWYVVGTADKVLPAATQIHMAERAGSKITKINASHLGMYSKPLQVVATILEAARTAR